ncbi:PTS transporter subunit EIIC [Clostridium sp. CF012]|uniref:PTS transporter subunit EIIC n=1 Tax=Clostridium sp. CF012 TaxID=2843319 RepID=UPI0028157302|nr:PTS transporter subunit EIIC [Clostridium sp. CF012]
MNKVDKVNRDTIDGIIKYVGGKENIKNLWHCMTRLRFDIYDNSKIQKDNIEKLQGVMGTKSQNNQFQIVIGTNVESYYEAMNTKLEISNDNSKNTEKEQNNKGLVSKLLDIVSGVFGPIVPAIAGAGMIKGLLSGLLALKVISATSDTVIIIDLIASGVFNFLPFFLAVSAAKIFKTNIYMALAIAGGMMYPTLVNAAKAGEISRFVFLGIPIPVINYSASVIPIIIAVWALSYIHKWIDKMMPEVLRTVFTPTLTLFVIIPLTLIVIGPTGTYFGNGLAIIIRALFAISPILAGVVVGAIRPIAVFTGMHHAMTPIALQNFSQNGYDMLMPMMFMANMAITGATFAIYFKTENKQQKSVILSAAVSGLLGITEPALFGVLAKHRKAFIAATIGSSVASAVIAAFGVRLYGYITSSIFSIAAYIGPYFLYAVLGIVIAIVVSFSVTYVLVNKTKVTKNEFQINS